MTEDTEVLAETAIGAAIAYQRAMRENTPENHATAAKIMAAMLDLAQEIRTKIREHK